MVTEEDLLMQNITQILTQAESRVPASYYIDEFRLLRMERRSEALGILEDLRKGDRQSLGAWMARLDARDRRLEEANDSRPRLADRALSPKVMRERMQRRGVGEVEEEIEEPAPTGDRAVKPRGRGKPRAR